MTPARLDLEVPRNGSDSRLLQLMAPDDAGVEQAIDITGFSFSAQARDTSGGAVIATASVSIDTAAQGLISLAWVGSQFDGYGHPQAAAVCSWDLKMTDLGGVPSVPVRGVLYITPEATA